MIDQDRGRVRPCRYDVGHGVRLGLRARAGEYLRTPWPAYWYRVALLIMENASPSHGPSGLGSHSHLCIISVSLMRQLGQIRVGDAR